MAASGSGQQPQAAGTLPAEVSVPVAPTTVASQAHLSSWAPLRHPLFRALWLASLASNIGTWVQSVAAVWLMTSLTPSPVLTALVQTASSLPLVIFALPAGALADMVDRRTLLIVSQAWMLVVAAALAVLTLLGLQDPWSLLGLTFALGLGAAFTAPAWQAINLELVPRAELPAAVALGSASINGARAVGPGLGGLLVSAVGATAAFLVNAVSFLGVIAVLFAWRREPVKSTLPREQVFGAIRAGLRFVQHSPALRRVYTRVGLFVLSSSALWAILPTLARHEMHLGATGYGLLLASLGIGAVAGAAALPYVNAWLGTSRLIDVSAVIFAGVLAVLGLVPPFWAALVVLFVAGFVWMSPLSSLNVATQSIAPAWVRARALAFHLLVFQGGLALGAVLWGWLAERTSVAAVFEFAAASLVVASAVGAFLPLKNTEHLDLTPAARPLPPEIVDAVGHDDGPVLITIEYRIDPTQAEAFLDTMSRVRRMRRRGGAQRWGVFADAALPGVFVESFLVESWLDHLRQHERMTVTDRDISARARAFQVGEVDPVVRHLIASLPIG